MRKLFAFFTATVFALSLFSCDPIPDPVNPDNPDNPENPDNPDGPDTPGPETPSVFNIALQLQFNGAAFAQAGIDVVLEDAAGTTSYHQETNENGSVSFQLLAGAYSASATFKTAAEGVRIVYNGSNSNIVVTADGEKQFPIELQKVESKQIIIKEVYTTGCQNSAAGAGKSYSNDAYVILYNNSEFEADASNIVFGAIAPSTANATNKFYNTDGVLVYENESWIPGYSAFWWFSSEVKIPAYSQIVVVLFGAIDHTQTVAESVNLSDPSYYWMNNSSVSAFTHAKYSVSESIPADHYLNGIQINLGTAWVVANNSPGIYIAQMPSAEAIALAENKDAYDTTQGSSGAQAIAKFPKANVIDAIDVWNSAQVAKSKPRFSADINTGYLVITNNNGYSAYRNVDKEATEALPENAGKLVYDYAGGTTDIELGSTDPSGIDAEASIAAGAHIIYSETNDSGKDFHQRKVASLKK